MAGTSEFEQRGIFTRFTDNPMSPRPWTTSLRWCPHARRRHRQWRRSSFRLVEESQGRAGADLTEHIAHAFATNLGFDDDGFNFVELSVRVGTSKAFELREAYFERGEPLPGVPHTGYDLEKH